jgi:3D (Asp-Asp-Asp) domain-containing protein
MRFPTHSITAAFTLLVAGCASRPLPKYEKPIARTQFQAVRTTAYTHSEDDHRQYGRSSAVGSRLRSGSVRSAAADWSRWPAGTMFRILETGETYQVDDYGWALVGTNTIDLYKPSRSQMNAWGVRRVNIELLEWGGVDRSLAILRPRAKYAHVKRMISQIEDRRSELTRPVPTTARLAIAVQPSGSESVRLTPFTTSAVR